MIGSHIIPRFYLEQFAFRSDRNADGPGRLWVYEKFHEPDHRSTTVQGRENGYFAYVHPDGTVEESLEQILAKREAECNEVLASAKSPLFHWPPGSLEKIAFYAGLLYSRTTQRRDSNSRVRQETRELVNFASRDEALLREVADELTLRHGIPIRGEIIRNALLEWLDEEVAPSSSKNGFLSNLFQVASDVASSLLNKRPWTVARVAGEAEFVTSDNPLITFVNLPNGKFHPGYGFRLPDSVAALPLAPTACLIMGSGWKFGERLSDRVIAEFNEALISICDRYVYSKSRSDGIRSMVERFAGTYDYGVNSFLRLGTPLPNARMMLRKVFRLPE